MRNLVRDLMDDRPVDWLAILKRDFRIHVTRDGALASLKYDPVASPMREAIVQQCRGMVVDVERRRVLAWPYHKFWNYGEPEAHAVDWSTARVQEKADGSLILLYTVDGDWRVASSGHPTAGGELGLSPGYETYTFRDHFWQVSLDLGIDVSYLDRGVTYMVELCHPANRVVVRHERPRIVLHGARDLDTGRELSRGALAATANLSRLELVREFPLSSARDCVAAAEALDPLRQEGFVVVDQAFGRVKIKSPRYVTLHHLRGEATTRRAIELWQTGETGELLASLPELAEIILPIQERLDQIAARAVADFAVVRHASSGRREFARAVQGKPWAPVLFRLLDRDDPADPTIDDAKTILRRHGVAALEKMLLAEEA